MHRSEAKEQAQAGGALDISWVVSKEDWAAPKFVHLFILL